MKDVLVGLPVELFERIDALARRDDRTRPGQIRWLLGQAVRLAEEGSLPPSAGAGRMGVQPSGGPGAPEAVDVGAD